VPYKCNVNKVQGITIRKKVYVLSKNASYSPSSNTFNLWLVKSVDMEYTDAEGPITCMFFIGRVQMSPILYHNH
jgi:hypothetical protein